MGDHIIMKENTNSIISQENNQETISCCNVPNVIPKDGNLVCINCGIVSGKEFVGFEQRAFTADEVSKRKRTEKKWRKIGSRTLIGNERKDSNGNLLSSKDNTLFNRLNKINKSLIDSLERNLWEAKPKLNLLASKLNIPVFIKETAWRIYGECAKKKLTMGRSIMGFVTASLYAAIRIHGLPRILDEVCDSELVNRKTVIHALSLIFKEVLPILNLNYKPITSQQLVYRFGNDLNLPMTIQKCAADMLKIASKNGLIKAGKDPRGLAASALYIAGKNSENNSDRRTQAEIATVAKITEVTLRSRAKEIRALQD